MKFGLVCILTVFLAGCVDMPIPTPRPVVTATPYAPREPGMIKFGKAVPNADDVLVYAYPMIDVIVCVLPPAAEFGVLDVDGPFALVFAGGKGIDDPDCIGYIHDFQLSWKSIESDTSALSDTPTPYVQLGPGEVRTGMVTLQCPTCRENAANVYAGSLPGFNVVVCTIPWGEEIFASDSDGPYAFVLTDDRACKGYVRDELVKW